MTHFDFAILGGGSAGYAAARTAAAAGLITVVIDGAEPLGGLCILRGCMPSKTLIESANRALSIRRAAEFGLTALPPVPDIVAIRERKRVLIDDFASYRQGQLADGRFELVRGNGCFIDAHTLRVTPRDGSATYPITAASVCITTGSEVNVPAIEGLADVGFWTSDDVLDASALPASVIVLGGGAIALEMAHYLEAMGSRVTLLQRGPQLLTGLDVACSDVILSAYRQRGMAMHCSTQIQRVSKATNGLKRINFSDEAGSHFIEAEQILVAMGRGPKTQGLGLAEAGVELKGKKIAVNESMQTTQSHIFAAGDVCSPLDVVHVAIQQGEVAARNAQALLAGGTALESLDYRGLLFGVFSQPQVAVVGGTEASLTERGVPFIAASYPFSDHGKSMVMGETEGFVKMLADPVTGEILGASVVGPEATELIHEISVAMHFRSTVRQFMIIPHYHPTLSEIWTYPAEELAELLD